MKWADVPQADKTRLIAELDQVETLVRNTQNPRQVAILVLKVSLERALAMVEQTNGMSEESTGMLIDYLRGEARRVGAMYETL